MKKFTFLFGLIAFLLSCGDSTIDANYNTIRTKKIFLIGEDGKEFLLQVKNDTTGKGVLVIEENKAH